MNRTRVKQTIVALSAAALVAIGGSAALAASGSSATGTSFLDRVAQHLGITTQKLQDAAKAAAIDEVAARLEAGAITQTQADAMKQAIESGKGFGLGGFGMGRHGHLGGGMRGGPGGPGGHLADAASYLGLTESALFTQLRSGMTLAGVAKAQGKTVEGLKAADRKSTRLNSSH